MKFIADIIEIKKISKTIINCFRDNGKLLICGNGGSAAMASHMAAEFICTFEKERKPLPAIALTTDTSILTAWSNDHSFIDIFSRQIEALGKYPDTLVVFSTSGKSRNCLHAMEMARKKEMNIIDFPRKGYSTAQIQEYQLRLMHEVVREVEKAFL